MRNRTLTEKEFHLIQKHNIFHINKITISLAIIAEEMKYSRGGINISQMINDRRIKKLWTKKI